MLGAFQPTFAGQARLEVYGQSFEHPSRLVQIGKKHRIAPEDRLSESPDPARAIEMENVGELVGDYECVPILVGAQSGRFGRRVRVENDPVGWKRRREAVYEIDVVGDDDIDRSSRRYQLVG